MPLMVALATIGQGLLQMTNLIATISACPSSTCGLLLVARNPLSPLQMSSGSAGGGGLEHPVP